MRRFLASLLLLAFFAARAEAGPENCGTIILPPGIGISQSADLTSFNPLFVDSIYNEQAAWLLYPELVWVNRFGAVDWSRSLAQSITPSADGQNYAVTLRPWHWSDGRQVTAEDVVYAFTLIKALGPVWPGYGGGGLPGIIKSITIQDATHFTVALTHPANATWFIYNGISQLNPLPEHAWKRYSLDRLMQSQSTPGFFSVTDGPLRLRSLQPGIDAVFTPNPHYDGPKMHFSRLIFRFLESAGAGLQQLQAGDLDAANLPFSLWGATRHLSGVHEVVMQPQQNWYYIEINFHNPKTPFFADVRVRQAIADAIDQAQIGALVYHGQGIEIFGPVPPVPPTFLTPQMRAGHYPVGYDPEKSRALLEQAGFRPGPGGIMQKDGKKLSFDYLITASDSTTEQVTDLVQSELRAVGIEIKVREMEFNQIVALLAGPPSGWEAAYLYMNLDGYPSGEGLFDTGAFQNNGGYSDPKMDALIARSVDDPGLAGLYAYETYTSQEQPDVFLPAQKITVLVRNRLHGFYDFLDPLGQLAPDQLYCGDAGH